MKSNILHILAFTFAGFACLKLGHIAVASETSSVVENTASKSINQDINSTENSTQSGDVDDPGSVNMKQDACLTGVLAQTLIQQQSSLDVKALDIAERETALLALEARVNAQIKEVQTVEMSIREHSDMLKQAATEDVTHLVQMYETMKPQKAAEIFNQMDPAFAAGFLRQINGSKAGLILAGMDARNSYKVSLIMAEQGASWRN